MTHLLTDGRQLLTALKRTGGCRATPLQISIGSPARGFLRPVATTMERLAHEDLVVISEWRNRFVNSFLTEFHATPERTARWLVHTVGPNESKMLFMLDLPDGETIGHIGIDFINWETGHAEADSVVRGRDAPKGLMSDALKTLIAWADCQLGIISFGVRVRSDNSALAFYRKAGFKEINRIPLRRTDEPGMTRWTEDTNAMDSELYLVHMIYKETTFSGG